jgi:hypothetical protein
MEYHCVLYVENLAVSVLYTKQTGLASIEKASYDKADFHSGRLCQAVLNLVVY